MPQLLLRSVSGSEEHFFRLCNVQIAMKELRQKKIPFTIRRYLPDGRYLYYRCWTAY